MNTQAKRLSSLGLGFLCAGYIVSIVVFLILLTQFIRFFVTPLGYSDPASYLYAALYAVILAIGIFTQSRLVVAMWHRSKKVAKLAWFDLLAGAVRAYLIGGFIWELRHFLPVYFFQIDACACSDYRPISTYYPLDSYYQLLQLGLGVIVFVAVALLPVWFFNRSGFARKTFVR